MKLKRSLIYVFILFVISQIALSETEIIPMNIKIKVPKPDLLFQVSTSNFNITCGSDKFHMMGSDFKKDKSIYQIYLEGYPNTSGRKACDINKEGVNFILSNLQVEFTYNNLTQICSISQNIGTSLDLQNKGDQKLKSDKPGKWLSCGNGSKYVYMVQPEQAHLMNYDPGYILIKPISL